MFLPFTAVSIWISHVLSGGKVGLEALLVARVGASFGKAYSTPTPAKKFSEVRGKRPSLINLTQRRG
jgi:hypothetical protein